MSSAPESPTTRRGLGRGLEVLVGGAAGGSDLLHLPVDAIHPNPRQPARYVVVVEALRAPGIWRALSLPALLPDFMVFDAGLAPAAGQQVLGSGRVLAAGFFERDWSVPKEFRDAPQGP